MGIGRMRPFIGNSPFGGPLAGSFEDCAVHDIGKTESAVHADAGAFFCNP